MAVKIAHISDLHFGMTGQSEAWGELKRSLLELRPDLILATGDLADSAQDGDMRAASAGLADLRSAGVACYVCPGNHDRKLQGNATSGAPGLMKSAANYIFGEWSKRSSARDPAIRGNSGTFNPALFDQYFNNLGMVVPPGAPIDLKLPLRANTEAAAPWRVRLLALDSSAEADYLAQGFIGPTMLRTFRESARFVGADHEAPDLVIVMVHHHLLPVAAIEAVQRQRFEGLFASTILLNAGTVLGALVDVGADLVLHGHEHARHVARYGTLAPEKVELSVIGAASATGANTTEGCQLKHSAFNLIRLGDDLNVTLHEYRYGAGTWSESGRAIHLLGAVDIRRARYLRKRAAEQGPGALPSSRVLKQFTYTTSRDAVIRQVTTNCLIHDRTLKVQSENASGVPFFMGGAVELPSGETVQLPGRVRMPRANGSNFFSHAQRLDGIPDGHAVARRVEHEILWVAGGVLTSDDLKRCEASRRGSLRDKGREFVEMEVKDSLESLTLAIELPEGHGPQRRGDVDVLVRTPQGDLIERPELSERLRFTGLNRIAVNVPYPLAGYSYLVTWRLPDQPSVDPNLRDLYDRLATLAGTVAFDIAANLATLAPGPKFSVGVYVPAVGAETLTFRLVGHTSDDLPGSVKPASNDHPFCSAHWGVPKILAVDVPGQPTGEEAAFGIQQGEAGMILLPLPSFFGSTSSSPGLARVAWPVQDADNGVQNLLVRAVAAVQGSASRLFGLVR